MDAPKFQAEKLAAILRTMRPDERVKLLKYFREKADICEHCGRDGRRCPCENDD